VPVDRDLFVEIMASYPAGVAVVTAVAVDRFASTGWTIVAAGLAAGLAAFVRTNEAV